ncbi:hypothetical protein CLHOM_28450 [Clostridium homopropionicum DSM 5847]|uniref:Transporter n=1 Tax=Clostridium homopropionicum DSM 5847 TaxID=1121318 RepID=A0A0L6Z760_9CLOT|nr:transporter [Clostridium homopropionicum]KOA18797.1 hypothetical protein CLHOM_28450 [Clostridium homopropionicum DSM 5847]SFG76936.1 Uncharacterized membrane protein YkvI [Clostridium homopropionicum]
MRKTLNLTFQISAVFIGTIVGAGLASGEEITLFFTRYGYKSFIGILICMGIYILMGFNVVHISLKYNLSSYNQYVKLVSPGFLGQVIDIITCFFWISSASIILAGSGALLNQYFHISTWFGTIIMCSISLFVLLRNTEGLIEINSIIVPCMILIVTTIFVLFSSLSREIISVSYVKAIPASNANWVISCLLYGGFNILSCSGVLVPLSKEINNKRSLKTGILIGALVLTFLAIMINFMLLLNVPNIYKYDIPLLYVANRFGIAIQIMLLAIMWLEMFSTQVSDIYSLSRTLESVTKIPYKKCAIILMMITIPISRLGFANLIRYVYPAFGVISLIFMVQCIIFRFKERVYK